MLKQLIFVLVFFSSISLIAGQEKILNNQIKKILSFEYVSFKIFTGKRIQINNDSKEYYGEQPFNVGDTFKKARLAFEKKYPIPQGVTRKYILWGLLIPDTYIVTSRDSGNHFIYSEAKDEAKVKINKALQKDFAKEDPQFKKSSDFKHFLQSKSTYGNMLRPVKPNLWFDRSQLDLINNTDTKSCSQNCNESKKCWGITFFYNPITNTNSCMLLSKRSFCQTDLVGKALGKDDFSLEKCIARKANSREIPGFITNPITLLKIDRFQYLTGEQSVQFESPVPPGFGGGGGGK